MAEIQVTEKSFMEAMPDLKRFDSSGNASLLAVIGFSVVKRAGTLKCEDLGIATLEFELRGDGLAGLASCTCSGTAVPCFLSSDLN